MKINSAKDLENALIFDIDSMIEDIMSKSDIKKELIELNQKEQLSLGKDALDQKIITIRAEEQNLGNVYSMFTISKRSVAGLQTQNVDLNFTGAFWDTFKVKKVNKGWQIVANFIKQGAEDIRDNFDLKFDFLGLTLDNLDYFVWENIFPKLKKMIKSKIK